MNERTAGQTKKHLLIYLFKLFTVAYK